MPTKIAKLENFVAGRAGATNLVKAWKQQWQSGLPKPSPTKVSATRKVRMLRVTAVLLSDDDGTRATGKKTAGKVAPVDGLLRNPSIHTKAGENYIDDWISLANKQLWVSGADFLLDRKNVRYVLEANTAVNSFSCGKKEEDADPALDLVAKKQKAKGDNPWKDSVLLLFPWGPKASAAEQGCGNAKWPFIKMAAKYAEFDVTPRFVDGVPVLGNNLLTHELGHFLGLGHTFPGKLHNVLLGLAFDPTLNPEGLPLTVANLPKLNGLDAAGINAIRESGKKFIATWLHDIDPDASQADVPDGFPLSVMVKDTPTNLGMGLPAMMGDAIGSGDQAYEFERFKKMTPNADKLFGTKKGDGDPFIEKVPLNKGVRLNVMSYWYANVFGQTFSEHQVERMEFAVSSVRANLIDRVVNVTVTVNKDSIDVTESAFVLPKIVEKPPEEFEFQMPEFGRREIEQALARVRTPTPALARLLPPGNSCNVSSRR